MTTNMTTPTPEERAAMRAQIAESIRTAEEHIQSPELVEELHRWERALDALEAAEAERAIQRMALRDLAETGVDCDLNPKGLPHSTVAETYYQLTEYLKWADKGVRLRAEQALAGTETAYLQSLRARYAPDAEGASDE